MSPNNTKNIHSFSARRGKNVYFFTCVYSFTAIYDNHGYLIAVSDGEEYFTKVGKKSIVTRDISAMYKNANELFSPMLDIAYIRLMSKVFDKVGNELIAREFD